MLDVTAAANFVADILANWSRDYKIIDHINSRSHILHKIIATKINHNT